MIFDSNANYASLKEKLDEYIDDNSLNRTISRYYILSRISEIEKTFTAKDVLTICKDDNVGATKQVLYDCLKMFEKANIIRNIGGDKRNRIFEVIIY